MKKLLYLIVFFITFLNYAQRPQGRGGKTLKPILISGTVVEQDTNAPLAYASIVLQSVKKTDKIFGGISDENGKFSVEASPGRYHITIAYIGFKSFKLLDQQIISSTDLGEVKLTLDVEQLASVEVVGERTTVEMRLDKKVYHVGQDLTVKGGSVTDVLDNVPSVSVDVDGTISLRGNESVRILINGKQSALSGLSPEALQQLPAEAIEKVEVITNPSARYDAEGTAGILNIILKQTKTAGLNGSLRVNASNPTGYGAGMNLNLRRDLFNIFTNTSYRYRSSPGNAFFNQENFNPDGTTASFQNETRTYKRQSDGFNSTIGFEFFVDATSSITHSLVYRKSKGDNTVDIAFENFDAARNPSIQRKRFTNELEDEERVQYSVNYQKKFNEQGHELKIDYQYSSGNELENSIINETILNNNTAQDTEQTITDETQKNQLVQLDYTLPFDKNNSSQLEFGYRGTFNRFTTDFDFGILKNKILQSDPNFSNELNYKEYVNAFYTQLGSTFGKLNILGGLRVENSNIGILLLQTTAETTKNYTNWFPSLFLGYRFSDTAQISMSYSRRLRRPRSRYINPFPSRASNTNLFQGNPNLDPTFTHAFDLGYLKRYNKITINSAAYLNRSTGVFQFIVQETGDFVTIDNPDDPEKPVTVPVQVRTPINLATDTRFGGEFTTTYTPKTGWRFTMNVNVYQQKLRGDYTYTNFQNQEITQVFDADNFTWFSRLSAKLPLPGKIDFQANAFYSGPSKNAQSSRKGLLSANLAFSKDIFKDKATLALNINDLFNSRKRRSETKTTTVLSSSEFQWRQRQVNVSFVYRFNQKKNERLGQSERQGKGAIEEIEG